LQRRGKGDGQECGDGYIASNVEVEKAAFHGNVKASKNQNQCAYQQPTQQSAGTIERLAH
jgi:hypothetical protein